LKRELKVLEIVKGEANVVAEMVSLDYAATLALLDLGRIIAMGLAFE